MRNAVSYTSYNSEISACWKKFRRQVIEAQTWSLCRASLSTCTSERNSYLFAYACLTVYLETVRAQLHAGGQNPHGYTWVIQTRCPGNLFFSAHLAQSRMFQGIVRRVSVIKTRWRNGTLCVLFGVRTKASWFSSNRFPHDVFLNTPLRAIQVAWRPLLARKARTEYGWEGFYETHL